MLLWLHVWNLSSRNIPRNPHRTASINDFVAAVAVLKRIKVIAYLPVTSIWIYRFVFVKARDRSKRIRLHGMLLLLLLNMLWMMVFMAVDDNRWSSVKLMIMSHVNVGSSWSLWMVMMIPTTVLEEKETVNLLRTLIDSNSIICPHANEFYIYSKTSCRVIHFKYKEFWVPQKKTCRKMKNIYLQI